jgi:hypothetical protein
MCKDHYEPGDLVVIVDSLDKDFHIMRVQKSMRGSDKIPCHCLTCDVGDDFWPDEIRHASNVEKAEYRLLGVA